MSYYDPVLECQACGTVLRHLTWEEADEVSRRPYDFVLFCDECRAQELHIEPAYAV